MEVEDISKILEDVFPQQSPLLIQEALRHAKGDVDKAAQILYNLEAEVKVTRKYCTSSLSRNRLIPHCQSL